MKRKEEILQELAGISQIVADIPFLPTYTLPEHYFDNYSIHQLLQIAKQPATFTVPDNYFNELPHQIAQLIKADSLPNHQPLPYQVPENYFDNVSTQVLDKINKKRKQGMVIRHMTRWSMAAVLVGLLGWGLISLMGWFHPDNTLPAELAQAQKIIQLHSFEKELDLLDEHTVVDYLQQTGHDVESAMVASLTDEDNSLPNAEDYFLDASTLNKYLDKENMTEFNTSNNN
jgi:hypothetical protein